MSVTFPTEEWFRTLKRELNENEEYQRQAEGWGVDFNGDFILTIEGGDGLDQTKQYFVGLEDGTCTEVFEVDDPGEEDNGFDLSGSYSSWKDLVQGNLGPIEGMMSGELDLQGSMNTLLRYEDASVTFVEQCSTIETEFI